MSVLCVPYVAVVCYNIVIIIKDCMYWTCGQCCVFCMWMVGSNIVIGLYVLDMWSVLCVFVCGCDGI